ncbi:hypothetical protein HQ447_19460 [bacterium]|nr:hypothetical protein [bacterium]
MISRSTTAHPVHSPPAAVPDARASFAPPYLDEDPDIELVQQGLDEAEDEAREAVAEAYQKSALLSDEPNESLDDIDFTEAEDESAAAPEIRAIHEEWIPSESLD